MAEPIIYVDTSDVRGGKLEELKVAIKALTDFVAEHEPQLLSYNVYFSEDGSTMTVIHVNADQDSLETHMGVGGPEFPKIAPFIQMRSIDVYGSISEELTERLHAKAEMLGGGVVRIHAGYTGFARFLAG